MNFTQPTTQPTAPREPASVVQINAQAQSKYHRDNTRPASPPCRRAWHPTERGTATMTPQELLDLAAKATPLPWEQWSHHGIVKAGPLKENTPTIARGGRGTVCECDDLDRDDDDDVNELASARDDAAYISAAANNAPDYARRLVELRELLGPHMERASNMRVVPCLIEVNQKDATRILELLAETSE